MRRGKSGLPETARRTSVAIRRCDAQTNDVAFLAPNSWRVSPKTSAKAPYDI